MDKRLTANKALQPTGLGLRARPSLASLVAAERRRWGAQDVWLTRVALAALLSTWAATAHAHGDVGIVFRIVGIVVACLVTPMVLFLFIWRTTARRKVVLLGAYLASIVASLALDVALIPAVTDDFILLSLLVVIPLCVWAGLILWWRSAP